MIRVFIDTTIFIDWLRKHKYNYGSIEIMRNLVNSDKVTAVISLDVLLELHKGNQGADEIDVIKNKWKYEITYLTPNFIVGNYAIKYKIELDKFVGEWEELSRVTDKNPDSKHLVTARYARCNYFLTVDNTFINLMGNTCKNFLKDISILRPDELVKLLTHQRDFGEG